MRPERSAGLGLSMALISAATFGTSGTLARSLIDAGWSPVAAVTARVGIAALVLLVPALIALRGRWATARANLGTIGWFGLLAVAGAQGAYFNAVQYLPVGIALLLEYSGVILVVGWMWAVHGRRPRRLTLVGAVVALVGLGLVLDPAGGEGLDPVGVLWGLGAAVGLAGYFVISARDDAEEGVPPIVLACGGMAVGAVGLLLIGAVGLLPMDASFGTVDLGGHEVSWLVPVLGLSLVAAVVAYVTGIAAARVLGAALSSFVGLTEVLFAVLIAWLVLGELPVVVQLLGGLLIVGGIVLVRADELSQREWGSRSAAHTETGGEDGGTAPSEPVLPEGPSVRPAVNT